MGKHSGKRFKFLEHGPNGSVLGATYHTEESVLAAVRGVYEGEPGHVLGILVRCDLADKTGHWYRIGNCWQGHVTGHDPLRLEQAAEKVIDLALASGTAEPVG